MLRAAALATAVAAVPLVTQTDEVSAVPGTPATLFAPSIDPPPPAAGWLEIINRARSAAGTMPVLPAPASVQTDTRAAAACLAVNGQEGNPHNLDVSKGCGPGVSTSAAARGAARSNISFSTAEQTPASALTKLLRTPFHAMNILRPDRRTMAFAQVWNPDSPLVRNRSVTALSTEHPNSTMNRRATATILAWPPPAWPVRPVFTSSDEWPSPIEPCGLRRSGPPLWFATPDQRRAPVLAGLQLLDATGAQAASLCVYDASGLRYSDPSARSTAAYQMKTIKATLVVPTVALTPGSYQLIGTVNGIPFTRTLSVET